MSRPCVYETAAEDVEGCDTCLGGFAGLKGTCQIPMSETIAKDKFVIIHSAAPADEPD